MGVGQYGVGSEGEGGVRSRLDPGSERKSIRSGQEGRGNISRKRCWWWVVVNSGSGRGGASGGR